MNYYQIGKKYNIINNNISFTKNDLFQNNNLIEFMRGYIEYNSKLILPYYNEIKLSDLVIFKIYFKQDDFDIITYIYNNWNIKCTILDKNISNNNIKYNLILEFHYMNVIEILSKLYYPNVNLDEINEYLYNQYMTLSNFRYISIDSTNYNLNYNLPKCYYKLVNSFAQVPNKDSVSEIGYNLSIIRLHKIISNKIHIYDTGIELYPQFGYYFEIIANTILYNYGYICSTPFFVNPNENKKILLTLIKIDNSMPELKLPFKCCKIILRKFIHYELIEK